MRWNCVKIWNLKQVLLTIKFRDFFEKIIIVFDSTIKAH